MATTTPILKVENLKVSYPLHSKVLQRKIGENVAVKDVSFEVLPRQTVGLVGESGSGKSTIARAIIGLTAYDAGSVAFKGREILRNDKRSLNDLRRNLQMVFQDPYASLNPRLTISQIIQEAWIAHPDVLPKSQWKNEAKDLLARVGLNPDLDHRFPHQFSGGQRQRIGIARALALKPKLIICDEAVSALDVSVQAQVLNLLDELKEDLSLSYLFISHDLSVVEHICDNVLVLNKGVVVEEGSPRQLFTNPQDDYTKQLFSAVPVVRPWATAKDSDFLP